MPNPFVWVELHTGDSEKAKSFYSDLLDWKLQPMPGGAPYSIINSGDAGIGGITSQPTEANAKPHWLTYIGVDDLDAATARAKELGAKINEENVPVPGMGRFTVIVDPTGAEVALWEQAS